ncbi:MAG: biotin/lipoyl-binding protein [Proteobacteria bacterium]|nr:biotin/lipoyl-binding protein [Pseudomonadota bacterium]
MNYNLTLNDETKSIQVEIENDSAIRTTIDDSDYQVDYSVVSDHQLYLKVNGKAVNAFVSDTKDGKFIVINGVAYQVQDADLLTQRPKKKGGNSQLPTEITPQTPSVVVSVLVETGNEVEKGQGVVVLSAMKMETTLNAPFAGKVTAVNAAEGDKVSPGEILVDIEKTESDEE